MFTVQGSLVEIQQAVKRLAQKFDGSLGKILRLDCKKWYQFHCTSPHSDPVTVNSIYIIETVSQYFVILVGI